ncbi:hypothetical protein Tco_0583955 [Tanacetum coccineum]
MESLNSNSQERAASVATNTRQSKGKLHDIFSTTSFTSLGSMLRNLDQLEKQLDKEQFQETRSMDAFRVLKTQFQLFINFQYYFDDDDGLMICKMNERQMQSKEGKVDSSKTLDVSLVVTECSGTKSNRQDINSSSGNYLTHAVDADIRPVNDQVSFVEVQLTAQHNVLANEQQHSVLVCPIVNALAGRLLGAYDFGVVTPRVVVYAGDKTSGDASSWGGEIDQNAKKYQVSCPLLDPSFDNMITEFSNQSLKSENISLKKTIAQLQKYFSRMEAHCVNMELKYQNQALKDRQHGQILNETSNKDKIKKEIGVLETTNIELEHSVAKLLAENEKFPKENEHLKQSYKDLYDSIKKTRTQTKDNNDSLIAQINSKTVENADLKAQI